MFGQIYFASILQRSYRWSGGAKALGKISVPGRPTTLEIVGEVGCLVVWVNGPFRQYFSLYRAPGRVAQSVGHLTRKSGVLGSIPGLATYFRFSFRFFKKGSCQLLAKVCARSTG